MCHAMCDAQLFFSFSRQWAWSSTLLQSWSAILWLYKFCWVWTCNWQHMLSDIWSLLSIPKVDWNTISKKLMWTSSSPTSLSVPTPNTCDKIGTWSRMTSCIEHFSPIHTPRMTQGMPAVYWWQEVGEAFSFQWQWHWNSIAALSIQLLWHSCI